MEKFVVIDGNSLINRAFYALPSLTTLSGKPCGAVYGFINMMLSVITSEKPKYLVCVFDAGKHTFRHDIYADYKGKRQRMPEDLATQLPMLKNLLNAMNIKIIEIPEIEADDIVGSISRKFDEEFILLSGDKDLFQLVKPHTTMWLTQKGISSVLKVNEEVLKTEFNLEPYQVIELKSIMGDKSDNIPGVPNIGEKGAMALLNEFSNLDNIYNNLDKVPERYKTKLEEGKDLAYLSKQLATIKLDVPLNLTINECELKLPFGAEAYEIMYDLGFKSILKRAEFFVKTQIKLTPETTLNINTLEIASQLDFEHMLKEIDGSFALYSDSLTFEIATNNNAYILYKSGEIFNNNLVDFTNLIKNNHVICFDCKSMMHELKNYNIELINYFDVSIAIYIANEMDAEISFEDALKQNSISTNSFAYSLKHLKEVYINKLINSGQLKLFSDIELPLVKVLFNMEVAGIKIDAEQIYALSKAYHAEQEELTNTIYALANEEFNINSTKQLQNILFEKLNIPYNGKPSTSIEVLNSIKDKHEIVNHIIRYRKISKLVSTYLDGMLNFIESDGKIHTTFMQRTTSTGRLSSREPNLQNLPIRDDEGKNLRKMFSSSFVGGTLISADYNQIELRLMANFSKDENMIADYNSGKDVHSATASKIFNIPQSEVTSKERRVAKSVNFGIIYGISAFGLSQNLGCSVKEASDFIKKYMEIYPKVKTYGEQCINGVRTNGYGQTIMGRIRHLPDINSSNPNIRASAERMAKNMPLQGSASDIIKIAMVKVQQQIEKNKLQSKLIIQIHDELIVDVYPGESEQIKQILKTEMEGVVNLTVPLIVEVSEGKTLYDAK